MIWASYVCRITRFTKTLPKLWNTLKTKVKNRTGFSFAKEKAQTWIIFNAESSGWYN